jgi:protein-S-isoprenylcysteine O-methyltransferase Ste14
VFQVVLFLAVVGAAWWGTPWPSQIRIATRVAGMAAIVGGASLSLAGSRALGSALTPFPRPRDDAAFRDDGVYALARHPIYGGVLLIALGGSLISSPVALIPTALLGLLFEGKRRREEAWLAERYPEYRSYRGRVRRSFLPFLW